MIVNELSVVLKARNFVDTVNPKTIPVSIQAYVDHIGAVVRLQDELELDEPGLVVSK